MTSSGFHGFDDEPTATVIDQYRSHLKEVWTNAHRKWEKYDDYYFRTFSVWDGAEAHSRPGWLRPARPTSLVDNAVDHQLASQPTPHRNPARTSEESRANADRVEEALKAILDEASLLEPALTWKQQGKNLVHLGYSIHELGLDSGVLQKRAEEPTRGPDVPDDEWHAATRLHDHYRHTAMPFRTRSPHPARILLDPWEKRPRVAIRHARRFSQDLHELTVARKARGRNADVWEVRNNRPFELILVDEYWTECWHAMMVSGHVAGTGREYHGMKKLLFTEKNTWGFVPYAHAYAGFGQEPTNSDRIDPANLAVGILDPVLADIRAQAQAVSGRHNALMDATFNPIGTRMGADELRDQIDQGDIIEMQDRGDVWRMEIPQLPRWMFQTEEWLSRDIEEGTFSRALAGVREQGVSTVGQQAILSTAAGRKFVGVSRQLEHLASVSSSHILQLIDLLDLNLTVRGKAIRPSYIESDYSVQITFDLVDPVLQLQQRQLGLQEVQAGLKSMETYWNADARLEDASGERKRLLMDWVRKNPMIHQALAMEVAREEGIEALVERALATSQGGSPDGGPAGAMGGGNGKILGPDGMPLDQTMGQDQTRQGLTPNTINPSQIGANMAG
jgi:hypothetical protein